MDFTETMEAFGRLFYIVSPNRTSFETEDDVPEYIMQAYPDLIVLFIFETIISKYKRKTSVRINDTIANISSHILLHCTRFLQPVGLLALYSYVHAHWKLVDLPWDSTLTWWLAFLGTDFIYYWFHRFSHEINVLWAAHQVHHSSQEFNMVTNIRQPILQHFQLWAVYPALALLIPPSHFLVHIQLYYVYQFWIHTDLIGKLGPLEYILNTPSHHRVHHGVQRQYIDKNYGGTLIIWDRMFGTFEKEEEQPIYGLTNQINTFEPMHIQFCHAIHMWRQFWAVRGWANKASVLFKGPGWSPGKPRLGDPKDIPDVTPEATRLHDPYIPLWKKVYIIWHFFIIFQLYVTFRKNYDLLHTDFTVAALVYLFLSLISVGIFLDGRFYSHLLELTRCSTFFILNKYVQHNSEITLLKCNARWISESVVYVSLAISLIFWILYSTMHVVVNGKIIAQKDK